MKRWLVVVTFLGLFLVSNAQVKVASILGDNMVLQRNSEVNLWGKAKPGEVLSINTGWNNKKYSVSTSKEGNWLLKVSTTDAGGPYSIKISASSGKVELKNVLLGEVWLCSGQSNMGMTMAGGSDQPILGAADLLADADNDQIRMFTVKMVSIPTVQDTCSGSWTAANAQTVAPFSAVGYMYARLLQQKLKMPVGVINSSWGGSRIEAWIDQENMARFPEELKQTTQEKTPANQKASHLYNGMIAPIVKFNIKGAIWYQGESNIGNYNSYAAEMAAMLSNWRKDFEVGDFPFYYVQIAPYAPYGVNSALQRDEQLKAIALISNSGMACIIDVGEEKCIHPADKMTVAKRLSYWALSETYGYKGIPFKSPVYKSMEVKDTLAIVSFDNVENGLNTFGKTVECLEIAGADKVFHPAQMSISSKKLNVWSPEVKQPVAVRYAFCNFPKGNGFLYNTYSLPVPSFRTDNWDN